MASREPPGATFECGPGNASKWPPGSLLERLLDLRLEMLQNRLQGASWSDFWAWGWKCFKMASWKPPGATFGLGPGNASKWPPESLLERLLSLGMEMLQNGILEASTSHLKCSVGTTGRVSRQQRNMRNRAISAAWEQLIGFQGSSAICEIVQFLQRGNN